LAIWDSNGLLQVWKTFPGKSFEYDRGLIAFLKKAILCSALKRIRIYGVVISDKEMATNPILKKEKLTPIGFRCNKEVYKYLQDKAIKLTRKYLLDPTTGQYIIDPQTNHSKKMLEQPHILMQEADVKENNKYNYNMEFISKMVFRSFK
jgi:hypothetical protein